jgi:hypothetical protein
VDCADDRPLSRDAALPDDWEIVRRHGNYQWWLVLLDLMSLAPGTPPEAVTLTVRQKSTGATRTVTAHNECAAIRRIIDGRFDFK